MRETQTLVVKLVDGRNVLFRTLGRRLDLSNIIVDVSFFRNGRQCYGFRFGPTGADGTIRIAYDDVDEKRLSDLAHQPWDFKTPLEELDDKIFISIPTAAELAWAYDVNKTFNGGVPDSDAECWLTAGNRKVRCGGLFATLKGDSTRCVLKCHPRGA